MSNAAAIVLYAILLAFTIAFFIDAVVMHLKERRFIFFVLLCVCIIGYNMANIGYLLAEMTDIYIVEDMHLYIYIRNMSLIFLGFSSLMLFLFFYHFYLPERKLRIMPLLFVIPALNVIAVLTSPFHFLLGNYVTVYYPVYETTIRFGPWFLINAAYSYSMTLAGAVMIAYGHVKKPAFYRLPSALCIIAIFIILSGNLAAVSGLMPTALPNITLITIIISLIFLRLALARSDQSIFIRYARGQVFRYLEDYILIMTNDEKITDINDNAAQWLSTFDLDAYSSSLSDTLYAIEHRGATIEQDLGSEGSRDIYMSNGSSPLVLNLRIHEITDKKANIIGKIAVFSNVTQNRIALSAAKEQAKGMETYIQVVNRQLEMQRRQYARMIENDERNKAVRHDMRHHLAVLSGLADSRNIIEVRSYLANLLGVLDSLTGTRYCENITINAVASHYIDMAKESDYGIKVDSRLVIPENTGNVSTMDLCVVLGNLLENAIEACLRITEGRFIRANSNIQGNMLFITVDNSFSGEIKKDGDTFMSAKRKDEGVGISSIKAISQKYDGDAHFEVNGNTFQASVMLRIENPL